MIRQPTQTALQIEQLREVHAAVVHEKLIALQQLLEEKIYGQDKLTIEKFVAMYRELELKDKQLELQAREYERRLESLNHEAQRILNAQAQSISVDKFDGVIGQYNATINQVREEFKQLNGAAEQKAFIADKTLDDKLQALSKQVYILMGGVVVIEFIIKYLVKI